MDLKDKKYSGLRLVLFFLMFFLTAIVFFLPLVIAFPSFLKGDLSIHKNIWFTISSQLALLLSGVSTFLLFRRKIEEKKVIFNLNLKQFVYGSLISLILITSVTLTLWAFKLVGFTLQKNNLFFHQAVLYLLVAISEELICRGYVLNNLIERLKPVYAIILSSVLFGLLHFFNNSFGWVGFINITLSGILMSILFLKYNNLSAPIGTHFIWNLIQGPVFGFNVSGNLDSNSLLSVNYNSTIILLTGGDFGIEGSLVLVPLVLIAIFSLKLKDTK